MINIQQDTQDIVSIDSLLNKNGDILITIDTDTLQSDLDKLNDKLKNPMSKIDKANIESTITYLQTLIRKTRNNILKLNWSTDDGILKSRPVELLHIPEYNIEMSDYISISGSKLVRVDYKNVFEIISIEMMNRDLGETMESMEEKLKDLGITGIYPDTELLKYFEDNIYNLSKQFKVGESPYASRDRRNNIDYFNKKKFEGKYYRDMVEYSIRYALTIIAKSLLFKLGGNNIDFKLCSLSDSGIYFMTTASEDSGLDTLINEESVVVRAFGRKFLVKPKITIF